MQMIGFLEATRGDAFISGMDIREEMNSIYKVMGVCPQHDLLWETLTAEEHLFFYARLKGLSSGAMRDAVDTALRSVKLYDVRKKRAGQFSGGAGPASACLRRSGACRCCALPGCLTGTGRCVD